MLQEKNQGFRGFRQGFGVGIKSEMGIEGLCHIKLFGEDGELKEERVIHNTVTELCDAHVADQMSDSTDAAIGYMSVGTGTGQTSASTGLATPLDQNALTSTTQGAAGADNDVVYVGTWAAGDGDGAITEAGILQAANNTTLMFYASFDVINKGAGDSLTITWTVQFGNS